MADPASRCLHLACVHIAALEQLRTGPFRHRSLFCVFIILYISAITSGVAVGCAGWHSEGHKCAISAEMAVWLCNCLCLYSYLHAVHGSQSSRQENLKKNNFPVTVKIRTSGCQTVHRNSTVCGRLVHVGETFNRFVDFRL